MEFIQETVKEFNSYCDTNLVENMTFSEIVQNIEDSNNTYFYISMCENDIIEAVNDNKEIAKLLELSPVYIKEVGVYILLHH